MKLLPHILCRITALPFESLEKLRFSDGFDDLLAAEKALENDLARLKTIILTDLKSFDATFPYFLKIRKLKKQIYKNKVLNLDFNIFEKNKIFDNLLIYNGLIHQKERMNHLLDATFEKENLRIKTELQRLSHHIDFQNALPLSSISFARALQKYQRKNPKDFRKKELQTESMLMQYLARMAAKTSPFSSFTKVSSVTLANDAKNKKLDSFSKRNNTLYNNFLLNIFQTLFISNIDIFNYLPIRINSTLKKEKTEYQFLSNTDNVESFQRVEIQEILTIVELYFVDNEVVVVADLVGEMLVEIEAERLELLAFVQELVEIGFLEVEFNFCGNWENWQVGLRDFVAQTPVFEAADVLFFEDLERQLIDFQKANMPQRILILENTHQKIDNFLKKYKFEINLKTILPPEQLIYEDIATAEVPNFEAKAIEKLVFSLHHLLEIINFLKGKERLQIEYFFNQFYGENATVPLLDFYENYYKIGKKIKETDIPAIQAEGALLQNWAKAVGEMVLEKYAVDENLNLEITNFEAINQALNIKPKPLKTASLACLALMYEEDGALKAVLNSVTQGYGKMAGRFLKLMPEEFTADLRQMNEELEKDGLMADNVDASFFNANAHLPLLKYEITMPKSRNQLSENQQLKLVDLVVCKQENEIVIWHLKLKKRISIFDLGIQTLKGRSPLYQLLVNFSPVVPDLKYLKEAITVAISKKNEKEVVLPRVVFENWVLFRKEWIFKDVADFRMVQFEKDWQTIQTVKKILANKKIEDCFFIEMKPKVYSDEMESKKEKPIYIDVKNIILLKNFLKLVQHENFTIKIVEMLPQPKNFLKIKSASYCVENVLHWYV